MEREAINKKNTMRTALRSITERLLQDAVEIGSNEELNNTEKIELLKPLNQVVQEKLDLIKQLDEQTLELEESAEDMEECLQEATQFELKSKKDILYITNFMDTFKIAEASVNLPNKVETDDVRLPRMTIAKFSGDVLKWQTFCESFTTATHNKPNISNVKKFNYLVGYLEGQAKRTVERFNIINENYQKALDLLCERFGNTQVIITTPMNELLKIKYVKLDKDVAGLRQLYDTLEVHVRSLLSLNVNSKSYGTLLSPIIMERLRHSVKLIISRNLKDKGWDLTELLHTIKNELYARETCENSKVEKERELPFSGAALHANQKSNHSNLSCAFCKEKHFSDKCPKVTDIATCRK